MSLTLTCPYCFKKFRDDTVHFRCSPKVASEKSENPLPDGYDDIDDFNMRYQGTDKEDILRRYRAWDFFLPQPDKKYEAFWKEFSGTTEKKEPVRVGNDKVDVFNLKVIDPTDMQQRPFLIQQGNDEYYIKEKKDNVEMATRIQVTKGGAICKSRVCPECHNPLPIDYGFYPVKFITLIGITNSGKTVYLSQFLRELERNLTKVGMSIPGQTQSMQMFCNDNPVIAGEPMPASTAPEKLQQPLIFQTTCVGEFGIKKTFTIVMYDIAGELFGDKYTTQMSRYAPFISHADGIIMLIDPKQFDPIANAKGYGEKKDDPITALRHIRDHMNNPNVPIAACISKSDTIYDVLGDEIKELIKMDYQGVRDTNSGLYLSKLNAESFNPLENALKKFMLDIDNVLVQHLNNLYNNFAYFAVTALDCNVTVQNDVSIPDGPVEPKRIIDPIIWLFYKFGFIKAYGNIVSVNDAEKKVYCAKCGDDNTRRLDEPHVEIKHKLLGLIKIKEEFHYKCETCGTYFNTKQ